MNTMTLAGFHRSRSMPIQGSKTICLLLLVVMQIAFLQTAPVAQTSAPKADPLLLEQSVSRPHDQVSVIIRTEAGASAVAEAVVRLGGTITQQLPIVNGFGATVPAGAIAELALLKGLTWISPNSRMVDNACSTCVSTSNWNVGTWWKSILLDQARKDYPKNELQGQGVTVAVLDSGLLMNDDFKDASGASRIVAQVNTNVSVYDTVDTYGHGTHIAGIIGGDGRRSGGQTMGVAPRVNLINVRVNNGLGEATGVDVIGGLQWISDSVTAYKKWLLDKQSNPTLPKPAGAFDIKVVNISLNADTYEDQNAAALNAAVEILWFSGIVVVVSAGNNGNGTNNVTLYPPANDPYVITVGAVDDRGTAYRGDDFIPSWSARGTTTIVKGTSTMTYSKPEVVAPGTNIASVSCPGCGLNVQYPGNALTLNGTTYFRASGTSMSAAVVSGVVALMLQYTPSANPDVIKWRLTEGGGQEFGWNGPRYVNAFNSIDQRTISSGQNINLNIKASDALWTGTDTPTWSTHNWDSVRWGSVRWGSVRWGSMKKDQKHKNAIYIGP